MKQVCDSPPPRALLEGIAEFNRGEYFECHETLEHIWMREPGHIRRLYQGILQIGVGLYHLRNGNYRGTLNLLGSGAGYLRDFRPRCMGVEIDELIEFAVELRGRVEELGPQQFQTIALPRPQINVDAPLVAPAQDEEPATAPEDSPGHW